MINPGYRQICGTGLALVLAFIPVICSANGLRSLAGVVPGESYEGKLPAKLSGIPVYIFSVPTLSPELFNIPHDAQVHVTNEKLVALVLWHRTFSTADECKAAKQVF